MSLVQRWALNQILTFTFQNAAQNYTFQSPESSKNRFLLSNCTAINEKITYEIMYLR